MEEFDELERIALVTGAGSGIGAATVRRFISRGWRVIAVGRQLAALEALTNGQAETILPLVVDVRDEDNVATAVRTLPDPWRDISVVVNAAGHAPGGRKRFDLSPLRDRLATVDTNLMGVMRVCYVLLPHLIDRGGGHIVNIGSVAGQQPARDDAAYTASKFGLRGFTEGLRLDLLGTNVRVTEIRPGLTHTKFAETRLGSQEGQTFYQGMNGMLSAEDIADCIMFAVDAPDNVTLNEIVVHPTNIAPNR